MLWAILLCGQYYMIFVGSNLNPKMTAAIIKPQFCYLASTISYYILEGEIAINFVHPMGERKAALDRYDV